MSDTSKLASDSLEPSMEDILSSIRKVITDDIALEEADSNNSPETGAETAEGAEQLVGNTPDDIMTDSLSDDLVVDPSTQQGTDIFENILDLEMLVDEPPDSSQNPINPADTQKSENPDIADDDMLDFIGLEGDEIGDLQDIELEVIGLDSDAPISSGSGSSSLDLENIQFDEMETIAPEIELDTSLDLVMVTDGFEDIPSLLPEVGAAAETAVDSPILEPETSLLDDSQLESPDDTVQATPDEDIDLVKSLLADLMDEPAGPEVSVGVEAEAETGIEIEGGAPNRDNAEKFPADLDAIAEEQFLAEELIIPDPTENLAIDVRPNDFENIAPEDVLPQEDNPPQNASLEDTLLEAEAQFEEESFDHGAKTNNTLAGIAKAASLASEYGHSKTPVQPEPALSVDDVVDISDAELLSKLTLIATATASSAPSGENTKPDISTAQADETSKPGRVESIQEENPQEQRLEQVDTQSQITTPAPIPATIPAPINEPEQEDTTMVTALQKETLIDEQTEHVTTTAFATLTTAVAEKSLAEENGPHIGELVKEALKPMLQEWLDKNLKTMVQRAVTKEIKRISSGK